MDNSVSLSVPKGWDELSQKQLRELFEAMVEVERANASRRYYSTEAAAESSASQVATRCFLKWTGLSIVCPYDRGWLLALGKREFFISAGAMADAVAHLKWIRDIPLSPVRLNSVDGASAVAPDLSADFSFDAWLSCETLWQAYIFSSDSDFLRQMAAILYRKPDIHPDPAECLGVFYWWAAVKRMVSAMFPNFFHSSSEPSAELPAPDPDSMRRNMDAQIRALTKGDISKEALVLSLNAIRALTELDAQAREYDELNKKYPVK